MTIKELFSSYDQDTCADMIIQDRRNHYLSINPAFYDERDPDLDIFHKVEHLRIFKWYMTCEKYCKFFIITDQLLPLTDHDLEVIYR